MSGHLGQPLSQHVTLELVLGINGGYGPDRLGWVRVLPDGGVEAGPGGGSFVVPDRQYLVITDVDWQWKDTPANAGAAVTLRLFVVHGDDSGRRLLESTIVLSPAGQGGTTTRWVAGGVFGSGTKIGVDTMPLPPQGKLQHVLLHGYLASR
ncbi:MAG: hypothetical protein R3B09_13355 [Nannocystaceae bacterium]